MKAVLGAMALGWCVQANAGVDLDDLRAEVIPTAVESWQTLDWHSDLSAARREAARTGKPVFMWSMNGNPAGCT